MRSRVADPQSPLQTYLTLFVPRVRPHTTVDTFETNIHVVINNRVYRQRSTYPHIDENGQIVLGETGETKPAYTLVNHGSYKAALLTVKLV